MKIAVALFSLTLLAAWTRIQYIDLYGGRVDAYTAWASKHYFGGLSEFYLSASDAIVAGQPYEALHHPPGYPYILAAFKIAGLTSVREIRIVQAMFDAAGVILMYLLARSIGASRLAAFASSAAFAVWPLFASGGTWPLAESFSVLLVLAITTLFVWMGRAHGAARAYRASISGVAIGLSALVRPDLALLVVAAATWIVFKARERAFLPTVVLLVAFASPIMAWGIHNRIVSGGWIFGSTSSGLGLWEGLGEVPNSYGYVLDDSAANHALMARHITWGSAEADGYFRQEYLRAWRQHPQFVARVIAARIPRILFSSERLQPLFFARARQFVDACGAGIVLVALWLRRRVPEAWLLLLLPPLYAVASIGLVHYEPRYVRYVHLSYLLAAIVVVSDGWRWLALINRRVALGVLWSVIAIGVVYTVRELDALHVAAAAGVGVP